MKKDKTLISINELKENVRVGRLDRARHLKEIGFEDADLYYNTEQWPKNTSIKPRAYSQINKVKESQDVRMGIAMSAPLNYEVEGCGRDAMDLARAKIVKAVCEWQGNDANMIEVIEPTLFDYHLTGTGILRGWWNSKKITRLKTFGRFECENVHPTMFALDPGTRNKSTSDASWMFYDRLYNRSQMERIISGYEVNGKPVNIDKIFKAASNEKHFDHMYNETTDKKKQRVSLVHYEYTRYIHVPMNDPDTGDPIENKGKIILFPKQEKRIVLFAGDTKIYDEISDLSEYDTWTMAVFFNNKMRNSAYASGSFKAEKPVQDLLNTILTLIINAQARQFSKVLAIPSIAAKNYDQIVEGMAGTKPVIMWEYSKDMMIEGIKPSDLKPEIIDLGSTDYALFQIFESIWNKYESVGLKEVLKGSAPAGVKSGVAISQLQNAGMQPSIYQKRKLEGPFSRLGMILWGFVKNNLVDETEIPVETTGGHKEGKIINRKLSREDLKELFEEVKAGGEEAAERIKMISIRTLDANEEIVDTFPLMDWITKNKDRFNNQDQLEGVEFVENDIQFGEFKVSVTMDSMYEQSKLDRMEQYKTILPMIQERAPKTALKTGLELMDFPNQEEILEEYEKEDQERQMVKKVLEQQQDQENPNQEA